MNDKKKLSVFGGLQKEARLAPVIKLTVKNSANGGNNGISSSLALCPTEVSITHCVRFPWGHPGKRTDSSRGHDVLQRNHGLEIFSRGQPTSTIEDHHHHHHH
uniref:Uncharacterized protein n=1 Tax=Vespula pensylvanica TaxID=30213 RepID=A0A834KVF6_VESPE|nr:hypothetical protein H0235_012781 [Vespula pensylvanica]